MHEIKRNALFHETCKLLKRPLNVRRIFTKVHHKREDWFWYWIISIFYLTSHMPIINMLLPIEYNILGIWTVNIRLTSMDICNPGNFLNTFGGACWIDNYMGIDDNNCILCVSKTCDNDTVLILLRTLYALNLWVTNILSDYLFAMKGEQNIMKHEKFHFNDSCTSYYC